MRRTSQNLGEAPRYEERKWDGEGRLVDRREEIGSGRGSGGQGRIEDVTDRPEEVEEAVGKGGK